MRRRFLEVKMLLCICIIIVFLSACTTASELHQILSQDSQINETMDSVFESDNRFEQNEIYREAGNNLVRFGESASFTEENTNISYDVCVLSVERGDSLTQLHIETSCIDQYLFDNGHIDLEGNTLLGYDFLVVKFRVSSSQGATTSTTGRNDIAFSLSDSILFNDELEACEMIIAGFKQPSETMLSEDRKQYYMRFLEEGEVAECAMIYLIKNTDNPTRISVCSYGSLIMFSLVEE